MTETQGLVMDCARLCDSHVRLRQAIQDGNEAAERAEAAMLQESGFQRAAFLADVSTLFGDDDYMFTSKNGVAYIAFLGTESSLGEWFLNAAVTKIPWSLKDEERQKVMVHGGFNWGWFRIHDQLKDSQPFQDLYFDCADIVICGHSRGGAIAQLAYPFLSSKFNVKKIITFGAPKVGDDSFVCYNEKNRTPTLHVRNWLDPVPWLPIGANFQHYGDVMRNNIWGHRMKLYNNWRGRS